MQLTNIHYVLFLYSGGFSGRFECLSCGKKITSIDQNIVDYRREWKNPNKHNLLLRPGTLERGDLQYPCTKLIDNITCQI